MPLHYSTAASGAVKQTVRTHKQAAHVQHYCTCTSWKMVGCMVLIRVVGAPAKS